MSLMGLDTRLSGRSGIVGIPVATAEKLDQIASISIRVAAVIVAYLAVTTAATLAVRHSRNLFIRRSVGLITPRFLTTLLIGITATAAPVGAQTSILPTGSTEGSGGAHMHVSDAPVMEILVVEPSTSKNIPWVDRYMNDHIVGHTSATSPTSIESGQTAEPTERVSTESAMVADPSLHVVEAGEHFWSIAESALRSAASDDPDPTTIMRYWGTLVDANRHQLMDPDNPDLIMPGQRLVLPPLP